MRRVGQARKRDANEPEVVKALQDIGLVVQRISAKGFPDLMVYDPWANRGPAWMPIEVKSGNGKLTPDQQETNRRSQFPIVRSVEEALALYIHRVH